MTDPRPPLPKPIADQFKALAESIVGKPTRSQRIAFRLGWVVGVLGRALRGLLRLAISGALLAVFGSLCWWALVEIWRHAR